MVKRLVTGAILGILVIVSLFSILSSFSDRGDKLVAEGNKKIAVIQIQGTIVDGYSEGILGSSTAGSMTIIKQLRQAGEDNEVRGVLLRVNSPGGSAAASQEIAKEIERLKHTGKPVVVSMGDTAASGGYWIAVKADKIIANPASITGSIGVIIEHANLKELFKKIGIDINVIKSGEFKDIGSFAREMSSEERKILQSMVNDIYNQFVDVVSRERGLPKEEVLKIADGRIFTGRQAKELGLVDELGNYYDALQVTANLAGIKGEPEIKMYKDYGSLTKLFAESSNNGLLNNLFVRFLQGREIL